VLRECAGLHVFGMEKPQFALTLPDADYNLLVGVTESGLAVGVLLSPKILFVHFNFAAQHRAFTDFHGSANAMIQVPCRLVADTESPLNLIRANSFPGFDQEQDGHKPRFNWQVSVMEDRACKNAELIT